MKIKVNIYFAMIALILTQTCLAQMDPNYLKAIHDAEESRNIRNDSEFNNLTVIDSSKLHTITVDNGSGGTKTIQAVKVTTMTWRTTAYDNATQLQRYVVDTTGMYRSNMWITVEGDTKKYIQNKDIPITTDIQTENSILEALGMPHNSRYPERQYKVLSFYVEPQYLTRAGLNPDISSNDAPVWNEAEGHYDFKNVNPSTLPNFIGMAYTNKVGGVYVDPKTLFTGPEEYEAWLNAWSTASYDIGAGQEFPYTGLGWTWNWNTDPNLNGFALSEFIVNGNSEYYFAGLRPVLAYLFPILGKNANEISVGNALDKIYDVEMENPLLDGMLGYPLNPLRRDLQNIVGLNNGAAIAQAFSETSPARYNTIPYITFLGMDDIGEIVFNRVSCNSPYLNQSTMLNKNTSLWADLRGAWTNVNNDNLTLGSNTTSTLFVLGIEKKKQNVVYGFAGSYAKHDITWNSSQGDSTIDVPFLIGYSAINMGDIKLIGEIGGGFQDNQVNRAIPSINENLSTKYSGNNLFISVKACKTYQRNLNQFSPFAGIQYMNIWQDSATESGGGLAQIVSPGNLSVVRADIGFNLSKTEKLRNGQFFKNSFRTRALIPFGSRNNTVTSSLVENQNAIIYGYDYFIPGSLIEVGLSSSVDLNPTQHLTLSYNYIDEVGGSMGKQEVDLNFGIDF